MKNVVILTAKGGNLSIENKNVIPVLGAPVMLYPLRSAKMAARVDGVFVSTEDEHISKLALSEGAYVIDRPASLARPESLHADVIEHAVRHVDELHPEVERITVLLGNTVMLTPQLIDEGFKVVEETEADSCMSVWKAQDDHPYRAMRMNADGYAEPFLDVACNSNRQSYPTVYFYDQGIWTFEKGCAYRREGPTPWVWLGKRCKMIERLWVTGRDIHSWIDLSASSWYLGSLLQNDILKL